MTAAVQEVLADAHCVCTTLSVSVRLLEPEKLASFVERALRLVVTLPALLNDNMADHEGEDEVVPSTAEVDGEEGAV